MSNEIPTPEEIKATMAELDKNGIGVNFCYKITEGVEPDYIKAEVMMAKPPTSEEEYNETHESVRHIIAHQTGIPVEFVEKLTFLDYLKLAEDGDEEAAVEFVKPEGVKLVSIGPITTSSFGTSRKWFDVLIKFSDGGVRQCTMTMDELAAWGAPVTKLSQTKKLKSWIMGAGREHFEQAVNRR